MIHITHECSFKLLKRKKVYCVKLWEILFVFWAMKCLRYLCITMELVPLKFWSRLNSQCVTFIKKLSKFKAKKNFSNHHSLSAHSFLVCVDKIYFCVFNLIDFFHFLIFSFPFFLLFLVTGHTRQSSKSGLTFLSLWLVGFEVPLFLIGRFGSVVMVICWC